MTTAHTRWHEQEPRSAAVADGPGGASQPSMPGLSVHAVTETTGLTDREVLDQLAALRSLGFAERDEQGKWHLTGDGATAVEP